MNEQRKQIQFSQKFERVKDKIPFKLTIQLVKSNFIEPKSQAITDNYTRSDEALIGWKSNSTYGC